MAKKSADECELNMTPMIDVVFQLMIFFILTIKMNQEINEDIILEDAPWGPVIKSDSDSNKQQALVIEIDKKGRVSIHNRTMSMGELQNTLVTRMKRFRAMYPIMVRADWRTPHDSVRKVMDLCARIGLWRINFVAVQEHKNTAGRHKGAKNKQGAGN